MKKTITSIFLLFFSHLFSQDIPNVIPPSPEATSLAKFIETPITHYTGTANIQIPIYTIKEKDITIPISLNYHTRGIKVEEIAPRVGLGWALNYGGSISRQTRGKADEDSFGYLNNSSSFKKFFSDFNTRINVKQTYENYNDYDHFPDKFLINANGITNSFIYDYEDKKPVLKKYNDLKIKTLWNHANANNNFVISGFIVTDKSGIKYYFGISADGNRSAITHDRVVKLVEYSNGVVNIMSPSNGDSYPNSWQLMDIITPTGTHIKYKYHLLTSNYYRRGYDKSERIGQITSYFNEVNSYDYQLKEIQFTQGKLIFNSSSTPREDISGGDSLGNIFLKNNNGKTIKKIKLDYMYSEAPSSNNHLAYLIQQDSKANKRLFLKSITENDSIGASLPPYEFTYNSRVLPSRFSTSQDAWGNYNGANNGSQMSFFNDNNDRSVDTIKSQAGILEEIKNPTGGKTRFIYEHNRGSFSSNSSHILMQDFNPVTKKVIRLTRRDFTYIDGEYKSNNIEIPLKNSTKLSLYCYHLRDPTSPTTYPDCIFNFSMSADYSSNGRYQLRTGLSQDFPRPTFSQATGNVIFYVAPKTIPGTSNPHKNEDFDFELRIEYDERVEGVTYAEGKRIKRIQNYDSKNELITEKQYSYEIAGNSSGFINGFPHFVSKNENGHIIKWGNMPGSPLSTFQGNSIGYSTVIEYLGSKKSNVGKIEYNYTYTEDGSSYYEFPYNIPNDMEFLRGNPLTINYYKRKNNRYELLKKIENTYLYASRPENKLGGLFISPNFIFKPTSFLLPLEDSLTNPNHKRLKSRTLFRIPLFRFTKSSVSTSPDSDSYKVYYLTGGTADLISTSETNYFEGTEISNKTEYFYDYNNHYQVAGSKTTNSQGKIIKSDNEYNILSNPFRVLPIGTKTYEENVKLSEQNTVYTNFGNLLLPSIIKTSKGSSSLEDRIVYHGYDDKGNPIEVSQADGTRIYYVWGYHQTQPIAKIVNLKSSDITDSIQNKINLAVSASNSDDDTCKYGDSCNEATLRTRLKELQEALPNSQMTYYTYEPLVGVTSITDARGYTTYYEYDSFNRLKQVTDADGKILSNNVYNYKTQQ